MEEDLFVLTNLQRTFIVLTIYHALFSASRVAVLGLMYVKVKKIMHDVESEQCNKLLYWRELYLCNYEFESTFHPSEKTQAFTEQYKRGSATWT